MTLPEPARKLWLAHADAVRKLAAAGETKAVWQSAAEPSWEHDGSTG